MGMNRIVPSNEPGYFWVEGAGWQKISDWSEQNIWDAEILPAGAIAAGTEYSFFANLNFTTAPGTRKTTLFTSMTQASQLPYGWRAIVYGIHFYCMPASLADDVQSIMGGGYGRFLTGNDKLEREGPLWMFPCPYGLTGTLTIDGSLAPVEKSNINNGSPAAGAIGRSVIIDIPSLQTFRATVRFDAGITLNAATVLYAVLRANINKPVR